MTRNVWLVAISIAWTVAMSSALLLMITMY
jgi:hypothetical protein